MSDLTISRERAKELAAISPEYKAVVEAMFPELKEPQPYTFDARNELSTDPHARPLYVGLGNGPRGLELQCLVVHEDYLMQTIEHDGRTCLVFYKKPID